MNNLDEKTAIIGPIFPFPKESVGIYSNGIFQEVENLTEEEDIEIYFGENISLSREDYRED